MNPYLIIGIGAVLLSGCAQLDTAKSVVSVEGAKIADNVRDDAEFILCRGMTVGAWVRAYGASAEKAAAWRVLCATGNSQTPAK